MPAPAGGFLPLGHGDLVSDGYNVMLTANFTKQQPLLATQRSFSAYGFDPASGITGTNGEGTWPGSIVDNNGNQWQPGFPTCRGQSIPDHVFLAAAPYRASAATDLIPESQQGSAMAQLTKTLPANNTLRLQYFYTRSEVDGYSGPMEYAFEMTPHADPNYLPKSASGQTCESNANTGGPCTGTVDLTDPIFAEWTDPTNSRYQGNVDTEQRILLTFSGDNLGWHYTTSANYSQNVNVNDTRGGIPNEAVLAPNGILSNLINPFGPQTAAGQALLNSSYLNGAYATGKNKLWSISAHASHELGDAFNAGTPATVALGAELSGQTYTYATTPLSNLLESALGTSPVSIDGSRRIQAVFVEVDVPIAKSLDLDISDREDRYSDFGTTNNGKVAVRWQPSRFVAFRGDASTGFRAPTLFNLYEPNQTAASDSPTMGTGNPLCQPGSYDQEWTPTVCASQGIGLYGGNKNLSPETSENFDLGIILSPMRNLGITLDYYRDILVKNYIQTMSGFDHLRESECIPELLRAEQLRVAHPVGRRGHGLPSRIQLLTCGYLCRTSRIRAVPRPTDSM